MESVGLWATSLAGLPRDQTPALAEMAEHGIWFRRGRAAVTHTTESLFSILTGVWPNLDGGFVAG